MEMTILGKVPSKSNCYRIITLYGHGSLAKTKALNDYERNFYMQCPYRDAMIEGYFSVTIKVFHENNRPDIDNAMKVLLDCLQSCKVIKNDRQCTEIHAYKFIDKTNPRVEITLNEIEL